MCLDCAPLRLGHGYRRLQTVPFVFHLRHAPRLRSASSRSRASPYDNKYKKAPPYVNIGEAFYIHCRMAHCHREYYLFENCGALFYVGLLYVCVLQVCYERTYITIIYYVQPFQILYINCLFVFMSQFWQLRYHYVRFNITPTPPTKKARPKALPNCLLLLIFLYQIIKSILF